MNAILEPVNTSFEQARDDLRVEAAVDRARRQIEDQAGAFADRLAGGATLEDMAKETPMKLGQIDWSASLEAEPQSIAAYPEFRQHAASVTEKDFPELFQFEDGGTFALRLDKIQPPALIPFAEVRDRVAADWLQNETRRQLLALAEERHVATEAASEAARDPIPTAATDPVAQAAGALEPKTPAPPAPVAEAAHTATALTRGGFINGVPQDLVTQAFQITEPGQTEVVDADNRVFLVTLDAIRPAKTDDDEARQVRDGIEARLTDSVRQDIFDYFTRALQTQAGVTVNQTAIDAVNAQAQ
jgi:peptidyl-prolyl cis-trans isomerase D